MRMMKPKWQIYDNEEYCRADILGTGSYQHIGAIGKTKMKSQIGFIRNEQKRSKNVPGKSRVPDKRRS